MQDDEFRRRVRKAGPESATWDAFKNKVVYVYPPGVLSRANAWCGRLIWVDKYSIGVELVPGSVSIVMKGPGMRVELTPE
jgi:hypothetical protein